MRLTWAHPASGAACRLQSTLEPKKTMVQGLQYLRKRANLQPAMASAKVEMATSSALISLRSLQEGPRLLPKDTAGESRRLFRAAIQGNWDLVAAMLASGADVNQPVTTWGQTLLHFAAQGALYRAADRSVEVVQSLLRAGADANAADVRGNTPLHTAAIGGWSVHYADGMGALVAAGADVGAVNADGLTPLHLAAERGRAEAVRVLVEAKAPVGALSFDEETAEDLARRNGHEMVAEFLQRQ